MDEEVSLCVIKLGVSRDLSCGMQVPACPSSCSVETVFLQLTSTGW